MKEYALITGASKGIGRSIALQLAGSGYNLLLVSRSETELQQVAELIKKDYNVDVDYLAIDLSDNGAALKLSNWCKELAVALSILINNAGFGVWGSFEELDLQEQIKMLNLNINALVELTYLLLPALRKQNTAFILNVASTAAYQAVPTLALYSASKAFVLSFSRALRYELIDTNVSVSCLCPGPTDTGFAHRAGMDALAELAAKFNMQPNEVAKIGLKGMFHKKAEIIPGFLNKLSATGSRHLNKSLIERITNNLYKK
jgi:short-subunit dehydrogenase